MAEIRNLFRASKRHGAMEELGEALVVANVGIAGCAHARPGGKRQVLLVAMETLRAMDLLPGIIRENITTEGLNVNAMHIGQKLSVSSVALEVSAVCDPCELMETIRPGLLNELQGRRGMLCRVLRGGMIRPGERICLQPVAMPGR